MSRVQALSAVEPGGLDMGAWGRLEIPDNAHIGIRNSAGRVRAVPVFGLLRAGTDVCGFLNPDEGIVVLGGRAAELVRIELTTDEVAVITELSRDDFRFMTFHEVGDRTICHFEAGVACLDLSGRLMWITSHDDLSVEFVGLKGDALWFASQWPQDRVGYRFALRLSDGAKVAG
jgi:hypothetical protein